MHYIVIWYLHVLWNGHHNESSKHISTYKVVTVLTVFFMLYIMSPWPIYFISESLYLLISFAYFAQHSTYLPSDNHLFFSLYLWVCFCLYIDLYFYIPHISGNTEYLSFSYFTKNNTFWVVANGRISFFFVVEQYPIAWIYTPSSLSIHLLWTVRLFPYLWYYI